MSRKSLRYWKFSHKFVLTNFDLKHCAIYQLNFPKLTREASLAVATFFRVMYPMSIKVIPIGAKSICSVNHFYTIPLLIAGVSG